MFKWLCKILPHKPYIVKVLCGYGFPADQHTFCTRCGKELTWTFNSVLGEYVLTEEPNGKNDTRRSREYYH